MKSKAWAGIRTAQEDMLSPKLTATKSSSLPALRKKTVVGQRGVDIHQVEGFSLAGGALLTGYAHHGSVGGVQFPLVARELPGVVKAVVERVETPIVEDGGAPVAPAEALAVHTPLAKLLSGIEHVGIGLQQAAHDVGRQSLAGIAGEEI